MRSIEVLKTIKNAFKRFLGDGRFPPISEIKEPTIEDVFGSAAARGCYPSPEASRRRSFGGMLERPISKQRS